MDHVARSRWFVGRTVLLTFGVLCILSMGNLAYHQGSSGLVALWSDPVGLALVVLAPFYLAAIPMAAVGRLMGVYDLDSWIEELWRLRDGVEWFLGTERNESRR